MKFKKDGLVFVDFKKVITGKDKKISFCTLFDPENYDSQDFFVGFDMPDNLDMLYKKGDKVNATVQFSRVGSNNYVTLVDIEKAKA